MRRTFRWQVLFLSELFAKVRRKFRSIALFNFRFAGFLFGRCQARFHRNSFSI
jgi:hypothetical protein